jgi:hypothetical protein
MEMEFPKLSLFEKEICPLTISGREKLMVAITKKNDFIKDRLKL